MTLEPNRSPVGLRATPCKRRRNHRRAHAQLEVDAPKCTRRRGRSDIDKYKVRLVARGFTQIYGVDYFDTFSPVAKLASLRTILAIAARFDWEIESFDFNGAYLNGELGEDEEIHIPGAARVRGGRGPSQATPKVALRIEAGRAQMVRRLHSRPY